MSERRDGDANAMRIVPWTLVAALLVLLGSAVYKLATNPSPRPYAPPVVSDPDQPIEAWVGEFDDGATHVEVRVVRLHAEDERQELESVSLRRRLQLDEGEPWRMLVRCTSGTFRTEWNESRAFSVTDDRGTALKSLDVAPAASGPTDPLRVSLAPWLSSDRTNFSAVLWGRKPELHARWSVDGGSSVELRSGSVHRSELEVPLARLDARSVRNKAGRDASQADHVESPQEQR